MQKKIKTISVNNVGYVRADSVKATGDEVIVRTYSAGVHIGQLVSIDGTVVVLKNARRLWKWVGAFTLNEVAMSGVDRKNSRISAPVTTITLTQAIEVIPVAVNVNLTTTEAQL